MDKILETKFVLEGARATNAPIMVAASTPTDQNGSEDDAIRAGHRLPPLYKPSPIHSGTPSGYDTESTYSSTEKQRDSSPEGQGGNNHGTGTTAPEEEEAVVAYFIRPGGAIVPVDILADTRPHSWAGSMGEVERPASGIAARLGNEAQLSTPELLLEQTWRSGGLRSNAAEHEAMFTDLAPAWMRPVSPP